MEMGLVHKGSGRGVLMRVCWFVGAGLCHPLCVSPCVTVMSRSLTVI